MARGNGLVAKFLYVCKTIVENVVKVVGPLFVLLASTLISGVIYVHFVHNIPFYQPYFSVGGLLNLIPSIFISFCIGYNYLSTVFTSPGSPPPSANYYNLTEEEIELLSGKQVHIQSKKGLLKWCGKCNTVKPPRTHHCSICGKCVLKMDHHCPWVANCVGHENHRFFLMFIFYLWLGCGYASMCAFLPFRAAGNSLLPFHGVVSRGAVIFSFVIATAVFVALTLMLAWQLLLALTNQTTIEFYTNQADSSRAKKRGELFKNPYDQGIGRNFLQFYGMVRGDPYWFKWLLPFQPSNLGDGIVWETARVPMSV